MQPDKCTKCDNDRFRQVGDDYVCKNCGTLNKGAKAAPEPKKDDKK